MPGHVELINVLWELGIEPDVRMLPDGAPGFPPAPTPEAAIEGAVARASDQWAHWPASPELETRTREVLQARFDELFQETSRGWAPTWIERGHEVLITWPTRR